MTRGQKIGAFVMMVFFMLIISVNTLEVLETNTFLYIKLFTRIIGLIGVALLIPWSRIPNFIFDNKEYTSNSNNKELVKKIRLRGLLFKNLSTFILLISVLSIFVGFYILIKPNAEILEINSNMSNQTEFDLTERIIWNSITVRFLVILLLIFLIQVLFRVFRYLLRLSAYYDGIADSIELHLMNKETDLIKLVELLTPDKYDIRELKQSSMSDSLLNLLKNK